jgi:hypothetical protein
MNYAIIGDYRKDNCHNYLPHIWTNVVPSLIHQVSSHLFEDHNYNFGQITVKNTKRLAKLNGLNQAGASAVVVDEDHLAVIKNTFGPEIGKTLHICKLI